MGGWCQNKYMKRILIILIGSLMLISCSPVLNRELMREGARNVPLSQIRENPEANQGKLFILGGVIIETRVTDKGSLLEVLAVPVNAQGYLRDLEQYGGRFLALYPRTSGMLDPIIYKKGREITLAGSFMENRQGKIDEMEYTYPVFEIKQIYLWDEQRDYYLMPAYPYYYNYPYPYGGWYGYGYDPFWWRPYPPPPGWR
jgi:outer membrane lipoprotein